VDVTEVIVGQMRLSGIRTIESQDLFLYQTHRDELSTRRCDGFETEASPLRTRST